MYDRLFLIEICDWVGGILVFLALKFKILAGK